MIDKLKNFPIVYWLSLPDSTRQDFIRNQFEEFGIVNKMIEPFDGKKVDYTNSPIVKIDNRYKIEFDNWIPIMNSGITSVTMSHLKMIKTWYDDCDDDYGFMGEDDMKLESIKYWNFTWQDMIDRLPKDWEVVQLNVIRGLDGMSNEHMKFQTRFEYNWGGATYIIRRPWAKHIIEKYIEDGVYNLAERDFFVPLPENIFYGQVRHGAYTLPIFAENTDFNRILWPEFFPNSQEKNNVHSANVCLDWWRKHKDENQLDLLFKNV